MTKPTPEQIEEIKQMMDKAREIMKRHPGFLPEETFAGQQAEIQVRLWGYASLRKFLEEMNTQD